MTNVYNRKKLQVTQIGRKQTIIDDIIKKYLKFSHKSKKFCFLPQIQIWTFLFYMLILIRIQTSNFLEAKLSVLNKG